MRPGGRLARGEPQPADLGHMGSTRADGSLEAREYGSKAALLEEVVGDKGYHSNAASRNLSELASVVLIGACSLVYRGAGGRTRHRTSRG